MATMARVGLPRRLSWTTRRRSAEPGSVKSIGNFWPASTSIFDFIRRAMPFTQLRSLSDWWLFLAMGVATDIAALILPTVATLIRGPRKLAAWGLWSLTFAFALSASLGFASVNITDTRMARTQGTNGVIETDERELQDAERIRDQECKKVGPICQQRRNEVVTKQAKRDADRSTIVADPQADGATKLIRWLSAGHVAPTADDFSMLRLALLTLLPQVGGLVLMVARR
jgi:membrane protein implicated in regulation of membrane protease activity